MAGCSFKAKPFLRKSASQVMDVEIVEHKTYLWARMSSRDPPIMKSMVDRSNPRTPATYIGTASFLPFFKRMLGGSDNTGSGYRLEN